MVAYVMCSSYHRTAAFLNDQPGISLVVIAFSLLPVDECRTQIFKNFFCACHAFVFHKYSREVCH